MFKLSDFSDIDGVKILRDGEFAHSGKLSTKLTRLCVPLRTVAFAEAVNTNQAITAVITRPRIAEHLDSHLAVAVCDDPDAAHAEIHSRLAQLNGRRLRDMPTRIDSSATIDPDARIADYGVDIGPDAQVMATAQLLPGTTVGRGSIIHHGVVLGAPGFNTATIGGRQRVLPPIGGVKLQDNVELLPNSSIARALFGGSTTIGTEVCADSLVYIAHDVVVGRRVQICAQANILGRSEIGDEAYIGPAAVIKNGLHVGARAKVSIGAVVTRDVPAGSTVSGNFAVSHERFLEHIRKIR